MKKNTKMIIGIIAVVAIAGGIYYFSKRKKSNGQTPLPPKTGGTPQPKVKWEFTDNTFTSTGKSRSFSLFLYNARVKSFAISSCVVTIIYKDFISSFVSSPNTLK